MVGRQVDKMSRERTAARRLSIERLEQLKQHAKCGTNDATPPEIKKMSTEVIKARSGVEGMCSFCPYSDDICGDCPLEAFFQDKKWKG